MICGETNIGYNVRIDALTRDECPSGTLSLPFGACPFVVVSQDETEYVKVLQNQSSDYDMAGQRLLHDAVDRIQHLGPFAADGQTQQLLDAAVKCRRNEPPSDVDAWASRLADDVMGAGD